jgi:hypothetical protein
VSDYDESEVHVPAPLESGVFANDIELVRDLDYTMLDFTRIDPRRRERTILVARVVVPPTCIIKLKYALEVSA